MSYRMLYLEAASLLKTSPQMVSQLQAGDEPVYADREEGAFSQDDFTPDSFDTYLIAELQ